MAGNLDILGKSMRIGADLEAARTGTRVLSGTLDIHACSIFIQYKNYIT